MYIRRLKIKNVFLILLMGLFLISGKAVYASDKKAEVPLVVEQHFDDQNGTLDSSKKVGTYMIRSVDNANPMPENSLNGMYSFKIEGDGGTYKIPLTFYKVGIYSYQIKQVVEEKENYIFDNTIYTIKVYVKNTDSGELTPEVIVENGNGKKCSEVGFYNSYNKKEKDASDEHNNVTDHTTSNTKNTNNNTVNTKTSNGKTGSVTKTIRTGDESPLLTWAIFAMVSFASIVIFWSKRDKRD